MRCIGLVEKSPLLAVLSNNRGGLWLGVAAGLLHRVVVVLVEGNSPGDKGFTCSTCNSLDVCSLPQLGEAEIWGALTHAYNRSVLPLQYCLLL